MGQIYNFTPPPRRRPPRFLTTNRLAGLGFAAGVAVTWSALHVAQLAGIAEFAGLTAGFGVYLAFFDRAR